jgi:hypothetical protein
MNSRRPVNSDVGRIFLLIMKPALLLSVVFLCSPNLATTSSAVPQQIEYLCPAFEIICPETQSRRKKLSFKVQFTPFVAPSPRTTYRWRVTAGKIIAGQGTQMITVDISKVRKTSVKATLKLGGFRKECPLTASCETLLTKP